MATRSRRRFDDDDFTEFPPVRPTPAVELDTDLEPRWSTYPDAMHGPSPLPSWVITSPNAIDTDLGVMKTGKEADVSLLRREHDGAASLMALKQYRSAQHRMFHRDAGYLEGRRVRRSRENRAMATRTEFGRDLIAGQWAAAEFAVLSKLWSVGAAVPYPVQLTGTELIMEFIGDDDGCGNGIAAPRLAQLRPTYEEGDDLFGQLRDALTKLTEAGYAHGDLSAYNILVHHGRLVLIDVPQAVDIVGNPQGFEFLRRDCENICTWFHTHSVPADPAELQRHLLRGIT
ncbi:MAG TPA: RIO1 family regulatory kinase/ATPase [Ilumatobacteraceae bacterium]|nr:RIO1 family regulatory kinase/ATPase [Ilumatobacteraceae bacterium]HRB03172.1 RIO1 family regulatory kinase/ATPase [Ilumatobacteraceae bacterium]